MSLLTGQIKLSSVPLSAQRLAHLLGAVTLVAGLVFWGYYLRLPEPESSAKPATVSGSVDPVSEVVAAWLGPGDVRLDIKVLGLVQRRNRAVALVAVNGAPPIAVMAGEPVMNGVVLQSIDQERVTLGRGGTLIRIAVPQRADDEAGIVRVP